MAAVPGPGLSLWETCTEFLAPGFGVAQPWSLLACGE